MRIIKPVKEQIIDAVYTVAAGLTKREVIRCQRVEPAEEETFISIWDGATTLIERVYGIERKTFQIGIEAAWLGCNPSEEANAMMAKIERRMALVNLSGLASRFDWVSSQPNYPDTGEMVTACRVTYDIDFATPIGDPYTIADI